MYLKSENLQKYVENVCDFFGGVLFIWVWFCLGLKIL